MKKTLVLLAFCLGMAAFAPRAEAQSVSFCPFYGMNADPYGWVHAPDGTFGMNINFGLANDHMIIGAGYSGGLRYRTIQVDTMVYTMINTPNLYGTIGLCLPSTNHPVFSGSIIGVDYGMALPRELPIGSCQYMKWYLQFNVTGPVGDKGRIGGFVKGGANFIFPRGGKTAYVADICVGINLLLKDAY